MARNYSTGLPFMISAQTVGAQKAWRNFKKQYGDDAARIFLAKADEQGEGNTPRKRCNSVFKTGAKNDRKGRQTASSQEGNLGRSP
jgi:hypothetical protein